MDLKSQMEGEQISFRDSWFARIHPLFVPLRLTGLHSYPSGICRTNHWRSLPSTNSSKKSVATPSRDDDRHPSPPSEEINERKVQKCTKPFTFGYIQTNPNNNISTKRWIFIISFLNPLISRHFMTMI
jgi:hypothetical protein